MTRKETIDPLLSEIEHLLEGQKQVTLDTILDRILDRFHCAVGTVHLLDPVSGTLKLRAQKGVAEIILDRIRVVPIGKGMAGLAAERRQPVQVCNLQSDQTGVAKPVNRARWGVPCRSLTKCATVTLSLPRPGWRRASTARRAPP